MNSPESTRFASGVPGSGMIRNSESVSALDLVQAMVRELDGRIVDVTAGTCRFYGWSREEMLGKSSHILLRTEFPKSVAEIDSDLQLLGQWTGQLKHHRKDGTAVWVASQWVLHPSNPMGSYLVTEVNNDITDLKRAEQVGLQSRAHLELALETAELGTWESDHATGNMVFGHRARAMLGRVERTSTIEDFFREIHDIDRDRVRLQMMRSRTKRIKSQLEFRVTMPDGSLRWIAASESPIPDSSESARSIGVVQNITARKESERVLFESQTRLRRLIEANVVGIIVADQDRILEANDYFLRMLGYPREQFQAIGIAWDQITGPESGGEDNHPILSGTQGSAGQQALERRYIHANGSPVSVLVGSVLLETSPTPRFLFFMLDLTERKRLEDQFRQAQKLESIGLLAGGIAHDFNNLLTVITGYSELAMTKLEPTDPMANSIEQISLAAARAASLTRQLLTFSRQQTSELKNLNLNEAVRNVERLLSRLIGEDLELELSLRAEPSDICADSAQLDSVVINLAVNARDAMPNGGKLLIETSNFEVDERFANTHLAVSPGAYVMLSVSDTGIGMSSDVQAHIFEPFFTTKEQGRGTGLGLSTVYGIVKQSRGTIWVYSEIGRGTTFKILLPAVHSHVAGSRPEDTKLVGGKESILIAEDDVSVRKFVQEVLQRYGYRTITATNGREALEAAKNYAGAIDLLITDVVMPEMGGSDLADEFGLLRAGVPILRMSGYTDRAERQRLTSANYIEKPFTPSMLIQKIRTILDSR